MPTRDVTKWLTLGMLLVTAPVPQAAQAQPYVQTFTVATAAEVVATITAACMRCDWGSAGREAVVLELAVDGAYSQHVVLTRSETAAYRVMLGMLPAGTHRLSISRDARRSADAAGDASISDVAIRRVAPDTEEFQWLSRAPFLRARPGALERFSDTPLL